MPCSRAYPSARAPSREPTATISKGAPSPRAPRTARELLDADVGEADVPDLPLVPQLGERADGLLERHLRVVAVQLVEVDAVDAESAQAPLARLAQVLRPAVACPRLVRAVRDPALRRK